MIEMTDGEWEHYRNNIVSDVRNSGSVTQSAMAIADLMPDRYSYEERYHNGLSIMSCQNYYNRP